MISQFAVPPDLEPASAAVRPAHVMSVAASRGGRHFAVATRGGIVEIRAVASRAQLHRLHAHSHWVTAVAFSPDGRFVASGSYDRSVKLWDLATGNTVLALRGHELGVTAVAFHPDGRRLASAAWDGTVRFWDLEDEGRELIVLGAHLGGALALAFSPDGSQLATTGQEGAVRLWRAEDGSAIRILPGHARAVYGLTYRADGRQLASAGEDRVVKVWDLAGRPPVSCVGHTAAIHGLAFHADGRLISGGADGTLRFWDASSGTELHNLSRPGYSISCITLAGDNLISGGSDGTVRLWTLPVLSTKLGEPAVDTVPLPAPLPDRPRFLPPLRPEAGTRPTHLLFTLAEQLYALPAGEVLGVLRPEGVASVPGGPTWLRGVAALRGTPLAVVDLASLLAVETTATGAHLVLLRGRGEDLACALLVDRVLGLGEVTEDPDASVLSERGPADPHLRAGRDTVGRLVLLVDPNQLPAPDDARAASPCLIANGQPA